MRNPIHKRLANLSSWQQIAFILCLCERMYPNFVLFCKTNGKEQDAKVMLSVLNLVWEFLTHKNSKINFDYHLEQLESIIPDLNNYDCYGVLPAIDASIATVDLLHCIVAGEHLEQAIKISTLSMQTVIDFINESENTNFMYENLKEHEFVVAELDFQWLIYRLFRDHDLKDLRDIEFLRDLKADLRQNSVSNIGIELFN